jgi:quinol monooxygenase YgiN
VISMPIVLTATLTPLPEFRDDVLLALQEAVPRVHTEPGCELYALHDSPAGFLIIEQWSDPAALKAHAKGEAIGQLRSALEGKLDGPLDTKMYTPLPHGHPGKGRLAPMLARQERLSSCRPDRPLRTRRTALTAPDHSVGCEETTTLSARDWAAAGIVVRP